MKLGIVGSGLIVDTLFQFIDGVNEVEVIAISGEPSQIEKLNKLSQIHNIKYVYTDYKELLANEELSTIYVAVPNHLHYTFAKQALLAGKNVILEKPFATNYKLSCELAQLAKEKRLILVEAISNQYNPNYLKIKELVKNIGDIKIVTLNYTQYSSRYDAFKQGTILPAFDRKKSGGALMDLNVYNVWFIVGLFGEPKNINYIANIEKEIDTSGILTLEYDTFKAVLIAAKDCASPFVNSIQGDKGCIYTSSPLFTLTDFSYRLNNQKEMHYDLTGEAHRMQHEFLKFAEIIDGMNIEKANQMLDLSVSVSKILTEARKKIGLVFPEDEI